MGQFLTYLQRGIVPTQNIFKFDNSGKPIKGLQYHLEQHGIEGYSRLTGGSVEPT